MPHTRRAINFRTLDLNLLRIFDEVMAERNLTRAARNLAMSQPAVSNALRRLRDALGDELVVRAGHGVEPTPAAEIWWPTVREALSKIRNTLAPTEFDPADSSTTFTMAMADATASLLLPRMIEMTQREAPGVSLRVQTVATRDPRVLLDSEDLDLAVGIQPFNPSRSDETPATDAGHSHPRFGSVELYSSAYMCVMRTGHPLAQSELTLDAYCSAGHVLVSPSGRPYSVVDKALSALGRHRNIVLTVNQFFIAGAVVARSDLLVVLPEHFLAAIGMPDALTARTLPLALPHVRVAAVWRRAVESSPRHSWLRKTLLRAAG